MSFYNKCILVAFSIVYLFCRNIRCFDFTNTNGTWIVRQTSDPKEAAGCSYVKINGTSDKAVIEYDSYNSSVYKLMVNSSKSNTHTVKDDKNGIGNLTIYGGIIPYFIVASVQLKGGNATYFVLTHRLQLANADMEKDINNVLKDITELRKIRFINSTTPQCSVFIKQFVKDSEQAYPNLPPQVIPSPDTTMAPPATIITSIPTTTTKKPGKTGKNNGPVLSVSNLVVSISLLFVFTQ